MFKGIILGILFAQNVFAGTDLGNGGGVYIKDNQVKTLAEAGTILDRSAHVIPGEYPRLFIVPEKTRKELMSVLEMLPIPKQMAGKFFQKVLGQRDQFMKAVSVNEDEYSRIVADYSNVLKRANAPLDEANFQLAAVSRQGKTYILPNFSKLSERQKALILVHEYFMRESETKFKRQDLLPMVLEVDAQLFQLVKSIETGGNQSVSGLLGSIFELRGRKFDIVDGFFEDRYVAAALLAPYAVNGSLRLSDLVVTIKSHREIDKAQDFTVEPSLVQEIPGIDRLSVKAFEGANGSYSRRGYRDYDLKDRKEVCSNHPSNSQRPDMAAVASGVENDLFLKVDMNYGWIVGYNCEYDYTMQALAAKDVVSIYLSNLSPILYTEKRGETESSSSPWSWFTNTFGGN